MNIDNEDSRNLYFKLTKGSKKSKRNVSTSPQQETDEQHLTRHSQEQECTDDLARQLVQQPQVYVFTGEILISQPEVQSNPTFEQKRKATRHPQKNIIKIYGNIISKELMKLQECDIEFSADERNAIDEFQQLKQGQNVYFTMKSINQLLVHKQIAKYIKNYLTSPSMLHGMMMSKRMMDKKTNVKYLKKFIDVCDGVKLNNLKSSEE